MVSLSNPLSEEIPPELGNLANLTRLNLSDNQLSGCVPSRRNGGRIAGGTEGESPTGKIEIEYWIGVEAPWLERSEDCSRFLDKITPAS